MEWHPNNGSQEESEVTQDYERDNTDIFMLHKMMCVDICMYFLALPIASVAQYF